MKRRAVDVMAFFDRHGTSNGPTEAVNGRLEHLRGSAPGFQILTDYISPPGSSKPADLVGVPLVEGHDEEAADSALDVTAEVGADTPPAPEGA